MEALNNIKGKEVLSSDGRYMGKFLDFTVDRDFNIGEIIAKINKDIAEEIGEDKPLLSSLKLGIDVERVKSFTDHIILKDKLDDLHLHFKDVSDKNFASSIIGKDISGSQGNYVGKVEDILVDTESLGRLSMLVKVNKDILETLDLEKPLLSKTRLGISMKHVTSVGDKIMLGTSIEGMGEIILKEPIKKM